MTQQFKLKIHDLESLGNDMVHLSTQTEGMDIIDLWMQGEHLHIAMKSSEGVDEQSS